MADSGEQDALRETLVEILERWVVPQKGHEMPKEFLNELVAALSPDEPAPAVEPVAWRTRFGRAFDGWTRWKLHDVESNHPKGYWSDTLEIEPLYTEPPTGDAALRDVIKDWEEHIDAQKLELPNLTAEQELLARTVISTYALCIGDLRLALSARPKQGADDENG